MEKKKNFDLNGAVLLEKASTIIIKYTFNVNKHNVEIDNNAGRDTVNLGKSKIPSTTTTHR
jgi:hypothetical protein